jgi:sporulation protein YlmC with PRC-barrel domain
MIKRHLLFGATALAVFALATPFASAQQQYGAGAPSAYMTNDHNLRTSQLVGKPVYNDKGEAIGTIDDVLIDMKGGTPTVILSVGKYLGGSAKMVAAPLDHIKLEGNKPMMAGADRPALGAMPSYVYMPMIEHGGAG